MLNKVTLIGRLGKDPEVRAIPSGIKVANFSIATTEKFTDRDGVKQEKTEWINCQVWRGLAEVMEKWVHKGDLIYIEGKMETRKYDKDGVTHYATQIVVQEMKMLGGKKSDGQQGDGGFGSGAAGGGFSKPPEDDLPF